MKIFIPNMPNLINIALPLLLSVEWILYGASAIIVGMKGPNMLKVTIYGYDLFPNNIKD